MLPTFRYFSAIAFGATLTYAYLKKNDSIETKIHNLFLEMDKELLPRAVRTFRNEIIAYLGLDNDGARNVASVASVLVVDATGLHDQSMNIFDKILEHLPKHPENFVLDGTKIHFHEANHTTVKLSMDGPTLLQKQVPDAT